MSEMTPIERAARALCEAQYQNPDDMIRQGSATFQTTAPSQLRSAAPEVPRWLTRVDEARAVLAAIREPSAAMLDAAEDKEAQDSRATAGHMWRAMIDATLVEGG